MTFEKEDKYKRWNKPYLIVDNIIFQGPCQSKF